MFGQWGAPYDAGALETVWRLSFFLGLVPVAGMLAWRLFRLEESRVWQDKQAKLKRNVRCRRYLCACDYGGYRYLQGLWRTVLCV